MQALTSAKAGVSSPWFGTRRGSALCLSCSSSSPSSRSVWCGFSRSVSAAPLREAMRPRSCGSFRPGRSAHPLSRSHAGMTGDAGSDACLTSVVAALGSRDDRFSQVPGGGLGIGRLGSRPPRILRAWTTVTHRHNSPPTLTGDASRRKLATRACPGTLAALGRWRQPQMVRRDFGARRASGGGSRGVNRSAGCTAPASGSGKCRLETRASRREASAAHACVMGGGMLTAVVILLAVGIGLVWLVTLGLCFSARRSEEQWDRSDLPTTTVVLRSVPRHGAHERVVTTPAPTTTGDARRGGALRSVVPARSLAMTSTG